MKAIQLTTPINVGDLDDGTDFYTHVRAIVIPGWGLDTNALSVGTKVGYLDGTSAWCPGKVGEKRQFELIGDDYLEIANAASSSSGQKFMEGFIGAILQKLITEGFYAGTVVDI